MVITANPPPAHPAAANSKLERDLAMAETRQLIIDLKNATQDGKLLAQRYAEVLQGVVNEYCSEFEKRAEAALARMDAAR